MSYSNNTWLDYLVKHPIFELRDSDRKSTSAIKAKQTRQDNSIVSFILQHHTRVITIRDSDLFVAVGSQIRVLNLTSFKDDWLRASQEASKNGTELPATWIVSSTYKMLDTPEINFSIQSLVPNKNGRLLAVNGEHRLVIVCLPRQPFSSIADEMAGRYVDCRTLTIGAKYYDTSKLEVLKTEWHPLSETLTHIVVLGNDNTLRIFDVSKDIEEPEQSFDLSPFEQKEVQESTGIGFSIDNDSDSDEDAVTFSLAGPSKEKSGWEPFTVYYALRSGHIYSLCPVIPYRSNVQRKHLENLACISEAKYNKAKASSVSEHKTLSHLFGLHTSWINALLRTAKIGRRTTKRFDNDSLVVLSDDQHSKFPVHRQGPFIVGGGETLDSETEACDLLYLNVNPVSVLALGLTNGTVHNYLLGSEVDPQWQMPIENASHSWQKELSVLLSDVSSLPKITLYEKINLKTHDQPKLQSLTLMADPMYNDTYFVCHATGAHAIAMNSWVQSLRKISLDFESGKNTEAKRALESWLKEKTTSEVRLLVNTSPLRDDFVPIIGLVLITDMYLSHSMLAITSDYRLVTRELGIRIDGTKSEKAEEAIKAQLKHINDEADVNGGYQALLPLPAFQAPPQLDSLPKQPKIVLPSGMNGPQEVIINEETLRFFSKSTEQLRRETRDIKKAASKIDSRLAIQQKEFERQVKTLREIYDKLQKFNSEEAKQAQQEKLKEISQKHAKLRLKIDEQLRTLMKSYQPDLSNEEKEWIAKLEELSKQIMGEFGYSSRIKLLQSQLEQIQEQKSKSKLQKPSSMSSWQLENIRSKLKEQSTTVEDVVDKMKRLEAKLSV